MTELEKSMNNRHAEVDLNKLVDELRAAHHAYIKEVQD